jgi:hypothetical protein
MTYECGYLRHMRSRAAMKMEQRPAETLGGREGAGGLLPPERLVSRVDAGLRIEEAQRAHAEKET